MRRGYTAASEFPFKMLADHEIVKSVSEGTIPLRHLQFIPTDRCNLHCSFCSCENRDKSQQMTTDEAIAVLHHAADLGCVAVTVTGGGEPLLHPGIGEMVYAATRRGMKVGLVSNGTMFSRSSGEMLRRLTWCRISASDERKMPAAQIRLAVEAAPNVDWAFSYVVGKNPNAKNLAAHIEFANDFGFTHVRVVSDILQADDVLLDTIRAEVEGMGVDTSLVIWQERNSYTCGVEDCRVSLLRPTVGADGNVYPCCGVQYAMKEASLRFPEQMCMGHWSELGNMDFFNGSQCAVCYYDGYNTVLRELAVAYDHREFV